MSSRKAKYKVGDTIKFNLNTQVIEQVVNKVTFSSKGFVYYTDTCGIFEHNIISGYTKLYKRRKL